MAIEIIKDQSGIERKLGCLLPKSFPLRYTKYSDIQTTYTLDEVRNYLANVPNRPYFNRRSYFTGEKWIRNQHQFGSCNGWSTALALSRSRYIHGQTDGIILSGSDAYSQMNGGQDNGSALEDGMKVVQNGIAPESDVPYNKIYTNQISADAKAKRKLYTGFEPIACDDEAEFASGLLVGFIAVVAVHANNAFMRMDGDGVSLGTNGPGNHSTGVDDMQLRSDGTILYDMFNSWDTDFCDGGRVKLTWNGQLRQTVGNHRFWLLRSANV